MTARPPVSRSGCGAPRRSWSSGPRTSPWNRPRRSSGTALRDDVAHTVVARTGHRAVVVRPRQDLEREMLVALEVFDQRGTATHVGLLEFGGGAVADDGAVVAQRLVDGVVAARANEHRIARVPHSAAARVCERAAEPIGRLDERDRKPLARSGIGTGDAACGTGDEDVDCLVGRVHRFLERLTKRPSRGEKSQPPPALVPPSTGMLCPVTNADWSEARNSATRAWSSGQPTRPTGAHDAHSSSTSS